MNGFLGGFFGFLGVFFGFFVASSLLHFVILSPTTPPTTKKRITGAIEVGIITALMATATIKLSLSYNLALTIIMLLLGFLNIQGNITRWVNIARSEGARLRVHSAVCATGLFGMLFYAWSFAFRAFAVWIGHPVAVVVAKWGVWILLVIMITGIWKMYFEQHLNPKVVKGLKIAGGLIVALLIIGMIFAAIGATKPGKKAAWSQTETTVFDNGALRAIKDFFGGLFKKSGTDAIDGDDVDAATGEAGAEKGATKGTTEEDEIKAAIDALTVRRAVSVGDLENLTVAKYKDISAELLQSSLSPHDALRREKTGFSDALTYGFNAKDDKGRFSELEEEILRNPVYGCTVARALKGKKIGDKTIESFNAWMKEMAGLPLEKCLEKGENDTFYVNEAYRLYAATLCTWLERLVPQGVQIRQTVENWCLNAGAKNSERRGEPASYQYSDKESLVFAYVGKNSKGKGTDESLFVVGFNIHDKRPEFFGDPKNPVKTTKKPTPKPTEPPTSKPSKPVEKQPTPTPTSTPTPTTPPPGGEDPDGGKAAREDAVNRGDADTGGGDNRADNGTNEYQAEDPREEEYVAAAEVEPETPPVEEEYHEEEAAGDIVDYEETMNYADSVTDRGAADGATVATETEGGDAEFDPGD